jgi:hypothetical protein
VETSPEIIIKKGFYASLCWHCLKSVGVLSQAANPVYESWALKFSKIGSDFGFRAPLAGGPLFRLLYQIPGDINPSSPDEMRGVLLACQELIREGSLVPLIQQWPEPTRNWSSWYHPASLRQFKEEFSNKKEEVCQLLDSWADFLAEQWNAYLTDYAGKLQNYPFSDYQQRVSQLDVFTAWRDELGVKYPYQDFNLVVCPESPTLASSLGPERVVIGSKYSWDTLLHTIVHEVGVRYVSLGALAAYPPTSQLILEDYMGLLKIIEAEICFRKPKVLPGLTSDSFAKGMNLMALLEWRKMQEHIPLEFTPPTVYQLYEAALADGILS